MMKSASIEVFSELRKVARPDSRFHFRFADVIPDFEGSELALERLMQTDAFQRSRYVFVTPDNSLVGLREQLLVQGVSLIMSSYNMARGFFLMRPESVPEGHEKYAAWLDGFEHFGEAVSLRQLADLGPIDLMVTGSSAVSMSGVRYGRGHGFFDLEWRIFSAMGLVDNKTPVATVVHDVQVLAQRLYPSADDVLVDWIATPTQLVEVLRDQPRPRGVDWNLIEPDGFETVPALKELARSVGLI